MDTSAKDIILIPFWQTRPEVWFFQMETQFSDAKIFRDYDKYRYVLRALDLNQIQEIDDILTAPPSNNKYEVLKSALITRFRAARENHIREMLEKEEIGNRTPAQYLHHLRQVGGVSATDDLLKEVWMQRLPNRLRVILAIPSSAALNELAELADHITELMKASDTNKLPDANASIDTLEKKIRNIETRLSVLGM